jgi:hypothetical protein
MRTMFMRAILVLVVLAGDEEQDLGAVYPPFGLYVIWSDDAGVTWPAVSSVISLVPIDLYPQGSMIPGAMRQEFYGDMALDRTTGDVYVVATRRKEAGSNNLDLFLLRGRQTNTGGVSPPVIFDPPVNLNLDGAVNWGEGPDQFMPEVVVDDQGGVNILYYSTQNDPLQRPDNASGALLDAYYTRVTQFGTPQQTIATFRLTHPSFCTLCEQCASAPCPYEDEFNPEFMGDYHGIDTRGCLVMVSYATTQFGSDPANKRRHHYTRLINICPADADESSFVDGSDPIAYLALHSQQDPAADLTMDGVVNADDMIEFTNQYLLAKP